MYNIKKFGIFICIYLQKSDELLLNKKKNLIILDIIKD